MIYITIRQCTPAAGKRKTEGQNACLSEIIENLQMECYASYKIRLACVATRTTLGGIGDGAKVGRPGYTGWSIRI